MTEYVEYTVVMVFMSSILILQLKIYKIMKQKKGITQSHGQEILDFSVNKISLCSDINTKLVWLVNDITN